MVIWCFDWIVCVELYFWFFGYVWVVVEVGILVKIIDDEFVMCVECDVVEFLGLYVIGCDFVVVWIDV